MSGTWGHAVSAPRPPQGRAPFSSSRETGGEGHSRPTLQYPNVSAGQRSGGQPRFALGTAAREQSQCIRTGGVFRGSQTA